MTDRASAPPDDPLLRNVRLDHEVELPVVGVRVRFRTNQSGVLDAVRESFGTWRELAAWPALIADGSVTVSIIEHDGDEGPAADTDLPAFRFRMPDHERVLYHTRGSVGVVDTRRGDAFAYVTAALVADREQFRRAIVEGMALILLTVRDRLPIHASLIARDGVALALAAPSGTGKSTLAYQAMRDGWTLLGDDAMYVQSAPPARYWGNPRHLLLSADAPRVFPELAHRVATPQASGKSKVAVECAHDWGKGPPCVDDVAVVLLARGDRGAIAPVGAAELERALRAELGPVHDLYGDLPQRALPALCARGGWRLTLTPRPADAAPLIDEIAQRVRTSGTRNDP